MSEKCLECKNYCNDSKVISVDYCKPLGVITKENRKDLPRSCGFHFDPK